MNALIRTTSASAPRARTRRALMVAVLTADLVIAAAPQAAGAAKRPDLVIVSMSKPPSSVAQGDRLKITDKVKNKGTAKAGRSVTRFYLSVDARRNRGDVRLRASRSVKSLASRRASRGSTTVIVPSTLAIGPYYLLACADDTRKVKERNEKNNCRASADLLDVTVPPTSFELIEAAIASGAIDAETGLVYKVFAAFGDDRLPAKYSGADRRLVDTSILSQAAELFDSLSSEAKGTLIPFLRAPAYPGTWEELDTARHHPAMRRVNRPNDTASQNLKTGAVPPIHPTPLGEEGWFYMEHALARIWFREDYAPAYQGLGKPVAEQIFNALDAVSNDLTTVMGRSPRSDAGPHKFIDNNGVEQEWGDGGNGLLDIYVIPFKDDGVSGLTATYPPGCSARPSFVMITPGVAFRANKARDTLAHEFMHVLQYTYERSKACKEYESLDDAVANWAMDSVYPEDDLEHDWTSFLETPELCCTGLGTAQYEGWIFPLFLVRTHGEQVIPAIYAQMAQRGPWDAVNAGIDGGFLERWPEFSRHAWNQEPLESFKEWDDLAVFPETTAIQVALGNRQRAETSVPVEVGALNRQYDRFTIKDDVLSLQFRNGVIGEPGAAVEAFIKLRGGTWKPVDDWTNEASVTLCRDKPSEDVVEVVMITSNSTFLNLDHQLSGSHKIVASADCLPSAFSGTFSGSKEGPQEPGYSGPTETWTSTGVTLARRERFNTEDGAFQGYHVTGGTVTYTITGGSPCSYTGSTTFALNPGAPPPATGDHLDLEVLPNGGNPRRYEANVDDYSPPQFEITIDCGDDPFPSNWYALSHWSTGDTFFEAQPNGSLVDTYDPPRGNSGEDFKWQWNFTPEYD